MLDQEKLAREEVLKKLSISEDTLSLYEHELEMEQDPGTGGLENFTSEDIDSIQTFHKLRESGLTFNEIKLLSSFSEILKTINFEGQEKLKGILSLSPVYRLKQSLNLARQELEAIKSKAKELEETLNREISIRTLQPSETVAALQSELDAKQKIINNLDRKLSEALSKNGQPQIKGKKAKELYQVIAEKETEISEMKKKSEELTNELNKSKEHELELSERIDLMEDEIAEMELEIEERYHEQISNLREQIEGLIEKKQNEWDTFFSKTGEQHRKELLTLQRKHEQEVLRLKQVIKEQTEELEELKMIRNPLAGLLRMGSRR